MDNNSVTQTAQSVNLAAVSPLEALADVIAYACSQHEPVDCIACEGSGTIYNIFATTWQHEYAPCKKCAGTGKIAPITSPRISLENIAAMETLLSDLIRQGGHRS